jgi:hypothetical protein
MNWPRKIATAYDMDFLRLLQNAHTTHFSLTTLGNLTARNGFEMHSGTEEACCIYRRRGDGPPAAVVNDYAEVMRYLRAMDQWRSVIAPWYFPLRRRLTATGIGALKLLGLERVVRRIYHRMQSKRSLRDADD